MEKLDLTGLDYLWEVCLSTLDTDIAESAISLLMNMSYSNLVPRLKRVSTMNATHYYNIITVIEFNTGYFISGSSHLAQEIY